MQARNNRTTDEVMQEKAAATVKMFNKVYVELIKSEIGKNLMNESLLYDLAAKLAIAAMHSVEAERERAIHREVKDGIEAITRDPLQVQIGDSFNPLLVSVNSPIELTNS